MLSWSTVAGGWIGHAPVTLGTANGLSLNGQELSLALADGATTGALSSADWSTFNNKQEATAALGALAAYNTNGLITQTAPNTFVGRTITGTANQIAVANGDGVAGNPVLSLPADLTLTNVTISGDLTTTGTTTFTSIVLEDPGVGTNTLTIQAPTLAQDYTLTLPANDGDANQVLTTDGNGALSWMSVAGSAQVNTRLEWANIDGDNGSIISSSGSITSVRNSTGTYTLTITPGLKIEPVVLATVRLSSALGSASQATV